MLTAAAHPVTGAETTGRAGPVLRRLAVAALTSPRGEPEPAGRYEFVHTQRWIDSLDAFARIEDHQVWWDSDGSMTAITTPLRSAAHRSRQTPTAGGGGLVVLEPAGRPWRYHIATAPGELRPGMPGPYHRPRDAAELTDRLSANHEPDDAIHLVVQFANYYVLTAPERAAILTMLAGIDSFHAEGPTTDRLGRPGVAITGKDSLTGYIVTFVFDSIGRLLAHIQRPHETSPPSQYQLFVTSTRVCHPPGRYEVTRLSSDSHLLVGAGVVREDRIGLFGRTTTGGSTVCLQTKPH